MPSFNLFVYLTQERQGAEAESTSDERLPPIPVSGCCVMRAALQAYKGACTHVPEHRRTRLTRLHSAPCCAAQRYSVLTRACTRCVYLHKLEVRIDLTGGTNTHHGHPYEELSFNVDVENTLPELAGGLCTRRGRARLIHQLKSRVALGPRKNARGSHAKYRRTTLTLRCDAPTSPIVRLRRNPHLARFFMR